MTVTEDETAAPTDHDRETDATTRTIAPCHRITTDEIVGETEAEAAEIGAEDETGIDERALAGMAIEMTVMAITETEDVRKPPQAKEDASILANQKNQYSKLSRGPPPLSLPSFPPLRSPHPPSSRKRLSKASVRRRKADRHEKSLTPPRSRLQAKCNPFALQNGAGRLR